MTKKKAKKKTSPDRKKEPDHQYPEIDTLLSEIELKAMILETAECDIAKEFLDEFKYGSKMPDWDQLDPDQKNLAKRRCQVKAGTVILKMFELVAQKGFDATSAMVDDVGFKRNNTVKFNLVGQNNPGAHEMANRINEKVVIVFVDPKEYLVGEDAVEPDKNQQELEL